MSAELDKKEEPEWEIENTTPGLLMQLLSYSDPKKELSHFTIGAKQYLIYLGYQEIKHAKKTANKTKEEGEGKHENTPEAKLAKISASNYEDAKKEFQTEMKNLLQLIYTIIGDPKDLKIEKEYPVKNDPFTTIYELWKLVEPNLNTNEKTETRLIYTQIKKEYLKIYERYCK